MTGDQALPLPPAAAERSPLCGGTEAPGTVRRRLGLLMRVTLLASTAGSAMLLLLTAGVLRPFPRTLDPSTVERPRLLARGGEPITFTFQESLNVHDTVNYHDLPDLLRQAFVLAEDQRFFEHRGVDWPARAHAVVQNLRSLGPVRGASTITEQVVRILHPRPRTLWSKWVEGWEARHLEERFSKTQILEFYLNQVPYARQRRGVAQAARTYFDRDLDTLSPTEMLTLAVLVRSPSRLDPERDSTAARSRVLLLADRLLEAGVLEPAERRELEHELLLVDRASSRVDVAHFVRHVRSLEASPPAEAGRSTRFDRGPEPAQAGAEAPHPGTPPPGSVAAEPAAAGSRSGGSTRPPVIATTLDLSLQTRAQEMLDRALEDLSERDVGDGALLVVDHRSDEILAWVNGGGWDSERDGGQIDKVLAPRQPGSTLKPFLYALALERGFTAASLIDDAPIADAVGHGLHSYQNYSRSYYGPVRLREALGNSLNTPAVRAARAVGVGDLLTHLRQLGLTSLDQHPDFYGDGLSLGNGEVSLYELVRAYSALARAGELRSLRARLDLSAPPSDLDREIALERPRQALDPDVASIIGHILSDPLARLREFGEGSVLNLPVQTAVKTGTSNDHRDAWAVGYSHRYTIGVWMGNVDRRPMREVSGSVGPALVLRALFGEVQRHTETRPLELSRRLVKRSICADTGQLTSEHCPALDEWFRPEHTPTSNCSLHAPRPLPLAQAERIRIESPTPGLHLALDPRIPDQLEAFPFELEGPEGVQRVDWWLDDRLLASTERLRYPWQVERGHHLLSARVWLEGESEPIDTQTVGFLVK